MFTNSAGDGHRERLRARFLEAGLPAFSPHELVELLLTLAIPRGDVKPLAKILLAEFGGLRGIMNASRDDLLAIKGVGKTTAFAVHFIREIIPIYLAADLAQDSPLSAAQLSEKISDLWRSRLGHEKKEVFEVGLFSPSMRLLRIVTHSRGTSDQTAVFPGEVIRAALKADAYAVAFAHNHPSGDPSPSDVDKLLTRQLVLAATASRIQVLDHFIVTPDSVFSFRKEGLL